LKIEENGQNIKFFYFLYFHRVLRLKLCLWVDFHEKLFYWSRSTSILLKNDIFGRKLQHSQNRSKWSNFSAEPRNRISKNVMEICGGVNSTDNYWDYRKANWSESKTWKKCYFLSSYIIIIPSGVAWLKLLGYLPKNQLDIVCFFKEKNLSVFLLKILGVFRVP